MKRLMMILTVLALVAAMIFSSCSSSTGNDDDGNNAVPQLPIVGKWLSEGANVAPLLLGLGIVKIEATFNGDNTYTVVSYDTANAPTTLTGTYAATKSAVDDIYKITVNQTSPTSLTSEGIFKVDATKNPAEMQYEIVQTQPSIGATPPTPEAGFGSTNGGALGMINVQKYVKVAQ